GKITGGKALFNGKDLMSLSEAEMRKVRGKSVSMIFQEPMTSLNPVFTVGEQIAETLILHENIGSAAAQVRALELMTQVGIPQPEKRLKSYPHELSGGQRQRVMIAMAIACRPD